jgi:hemerythrin-like domain-containing protein
MKATELLQKQHRDIEALLNKLRSAGQGDEKSIKNELATMLVAHTAIEEESFYPAMRDALPEEILEAIEEHGLADVELARLLAAPAGDDECNEARTAVLSEIFIRHVRREETDIFKVADRELGEDMLTGLGDTMARRFRQILEGGHAKLLQKSLDEVVPRLSPRRAAKKTARRAPAAAAKKKTARRSPAAAAPKRAATRRATTKRGQAATTRKGKSARNAATAPATRTSRAGSAAAGTRTRA